MRSMIIASRAFFIALLAASAVACTGSDKQTSTGSSGPPLDPSEFEVVPRSCVYTCPIGSCPEHSGDYSCPAMGAWNAIGHEDTCEVWDGKFPAVLNGKCVATDPTAEALKYAGADPNDPLVKIMPGGRRQRPFGQSWAFREADLYAGMTSNVLAIPGTNFVVTVDSGYGDHALRLVDTAKVGQGDPVVSLVKYPAPATLNWGITFAVPNRIYVSTADGKVNALTVDTVAGTLTQSDALAVNLPPSTNSTGNTVGWYTSGVAASADGKRLVVSPVWEKELLVYDIDPLSANYGAKLGQVSLGDNETFGVFFDPLDTIGERAYVSLWADSEVVEVDLTTVTAPAVKRKFATGKDPEGIAFLDERWMVVADDLGDSLSLVDRISGTVTSIPIAMDGAVHGHEPSVLAYDKPAKRLYVALAASGAIAAYAVDTTKTPPSMTPDGSLPTQWWPSGIVVLADGTVAVSSLRGEGKGPSDFPYSIETGSDGDAYLGLHGGIQVFPKPSVAELSAGANDVRINNGVGALPGYPKVDCPAGVMDFPIPPTNENGPSPVIDHVFIIVRENKTYDALFGDMANAKGKADLTLKAASKDMDSVWQNLRTLARTFTFSDNFYTGAEISSLGHVWTAYGRSNEYNERTWASAGYGRSARPGDVQNGGVVDVGRPEEGSMFDWLGKAGITYDVLGEGVGIPTIYVDGHPPNDLKYPGGFIQNITYPDIEKACYTASRVRVRCDLGQVVYMTLPNDHTIGLSPSNPDPETMCAVNDEATGLVVSAISKSPVWKKSLIMITEDDPAQGGDHVDAHRTVFVVISPWVRRAYVSKTHTDVSSMHKIVAHVLGLPYPNIQVENAALPYDMFTSTPDYTPVEYIPRSWPAACGVKSTKAEQNLTKKWDIDDVDRSPGLDQQVMRWMRGKQLLDTEQKKDAED